MNKTRSNALWKLTPDQRNALDKWLFEEKQSYTQVWQRAQAQFRYKGSKSSVRRYHNRRRKERIIEEFKDLRDEMAAISGAPVDATTARQISMKLMGTFLFQQLRRAMVQNDYNETRREEQELRREMKTEDQKIRREAMEFAKDKFEYDTIENAVKALPELQKVAESMGDADTTRYRERSNAARKAMFGPGEKAPHEEAERSSEGNDQGPSAKEAPNFKTQARNDE